MAVNEIGKSLTTKKPSVIHDSFHLPDRNNKNLIILKSNSQKQSNDHTANTVVNPVVSITAAVLLASNDFGATKEK